MASSHFTLENLPYGVISIDQQGPGRYLATAYKEYAIIYKDLISDHNADFRALSKWPMLEPTLQQVRKTELRALTSPILIILLAANME